MTPPGPSAEGWSQQDRSTFQQFEVLIYGYFDLTEYFSKEWPGDRPSSVMRNRGGSSIRMTVENMATFLANFPETEREQYPLQFKSVNEWQLRHGRT